MGNEAKVWWLKLHKLQTLESDWFTDCVIAPRNMWEPEARLMNFIWKDDYDQLLADARELRKYMKEYLDSAYGNDSEEFLAKFDAKYGEG